MKITLSGASDDLIEIEGDIREEFNWNCDDSEKGYLAVSDGTLIEIVYNGFWRLHVLAHGTATLSKTEGTHEDTDYSDKVTLEGDAVRWVVFGTDMARP